MGLPLRGENLLPSSADLGTATPSAAGDLGGRRSPTKFGFPLRIRIPTKLGVENPKHVIGIAVLNNYTGGYWEDQGYNWFSGL